MRKTAAFHLRLRKIDGGRAIGRDEAAAQQMRTDEGDALQPAFDPCHLIEGCLVEAKFLERQSYQGHLPPVRLCEIAVAQRRLVELCQLEGSPHHLAVIEVRLAAIGFVQRGTVEDRVLAPRAPQVGLEQMGACHRCVAQLGPCQHGLREIAVVELRALEVRVFERSAHETGTSQVHPGQVDPGQVQA
ncbi:hypothetical protein D3C72_1472690 [compost metagenome]